MLSYAGIPLPLVTPQLSEFLERYMATSQLPWFERVQATSPEVLCSVITRFDIQPHFKLSRLIWPTGLSSPATALFIATTPILELILAQTDVNSQRIAKPLKIGKDVSVDMIMLDPVQVVGAPDSQEGLWLIPLVDERHNFINNAQYEFTGDVIDTWQEWLEAAHSALDITCTIHEIDPDFLKPGAIYYPPKDSPGLSILMDSAAWTIGRRYVRQFNGDYQLQRYQDGVALAVPVSGFNVISGSRHLNSVTLSPLKYRFAFHNGGTAEALMTTVAGSPPSQPYQRVVFDGTRVIKIRCAMPTGSQQAADDYAGAWANEHTKWKTIRQDLAFAGAPPYTLTGGDNYVEILCDATTCITRVYSSHEEAIESLSVRFGPLAEAECDGCGKGGGGPDICPRVSNVTCTAGFMIVSYQLQCEAVTEPVGQPPAGGPVGTIAMWSVGTIPDGWLECNGAQFDATVYPELFVALGGNTWNVPDLRDKFVRGHGVTGKGNLRDAKPYKTGAPTIPFTAAAAGSHSHTNAPGTPIMIAQGSGGMTLSGYTNTGTTSTQQNHTHTISGGDSETVPEHIILKFIIKART